MSALKCCAAGARGLTSAACQSTARTVRRYKAWAQAAVSVIAGVVTELREQHAGVAELGQVTHTGRVEATDQVIALVLHHPGMEIVGLAHDLLAGKVGK